MPNTQITGRPYASTADLEALIDLLAVTRPAGRISDYPSIVDLQEMLGTSATQANTRLWEDAGGRVVAFALVDTYNNLCFEIAPETAGDDVEVQIVDWSVECLRRVAQERDAAVTLDASCNEDDVGRIALLERHGFVPQTVRSLRMARPLDAPIPAPQVPAGFVVRPVAGEHEAEVLVALHRAAHGTAHLTVAERLAWMRVPEYEPELDLVAVAADGTLAAYCMCAVSEDENARSGRNEGYVDPIATHPAYQRRGLARALMLTGLRALQARGLDTAVLGTSSENVAMQRAAESVGFRVQSSKIWFAKPLVDSQ